MKVIINGSLITYDNKITTSSCRATMIIKNNKITYIDFRGKQRPRGKDNWLWFYKYRTVGSLINETELETILSYNDVDGNKSIFNEEQEEQ